MPIRLTAGRMSTRRKAKVIPTASASMLVATASRNISLKYMVLLAFSSSLEKASFIMLMPISASRIKAIQ